MNSRKQNPVVIVLAANERYAPGLQCALWTILCHASPNRFLSFHLLDGGLSRDSRELAERLISTREAAEFHWHSVDDAVFRHAHLAHGKSRMAYARLMATELIQESRCIYLDTDVLVFKDITRLYDISLPSDCCIAAAPDSETLTLSDDSKSIPLKFELPPDGEYFNSGVLLMDLDRLRQMDFLNQAMNFLNTHKGEHIFHDQSAINFLLHGQILKIDSSWNLASWQFDEQTDNSLECILHYTASAPWLTSSTRPSQTVFDHVAQSIGLSTENASTLKKQGNRVKAKKLALAPIRSVVHSVLSTTYKLTGRSLLAKQHQQTSHYWSKYLLTYAAREKLGRQRISKLEQSLAIPQPSVNLP
ncbi:glycosyltransferase family 8 protein [Planctomicrobium sp. SH527]|uniref:glycosyltransferase family 8 protein n=1 Tax=Planctomicrobium sp. SH527 TaxID=3448123 RepID=UPI003F5C7B6E